MVNKENLRATLAAIEANPEHWDQLTWHCGTSHCFAGFAEMLRLGRSPTEQLGESSCIRALASLKATSEWLGLNDWQWMAITNCDNTLDDLEDRVAELCGDPEAELTDSVTVDA